MVQLRVVESSLSQSQNDPIMDSLTEHHLHLQPIAQSSLNNESKPCWPAILSPTLPQSWQDFREDEQVQFLPTVEESQSAELDTRDRSFVFSVQDDSILPGIQVDRGNQFETKNEEPQAESKEAQYPLNEALTQQVQSRERPLKNDSHLSKDGALVPVVYHQTKENIFRKGNERKTNTIKKEVAFETRPNVEIHASMELQGPSSSQTDSEETEDESNRFAQVKNSLDFVNVRPKHPLEVTFQDTRLSSCHSLARIPSPPSLTRFALGPAPSMDQTEVWAHRPEESLFLPALLLSQNHEAHSARVQFEDQTELELSQSDIRLFRMRAGDTALARLSPQPHGAAYQPVFISSSLVDGTIWVSLMETPAVLISISSRQLALTATDLQRADTLDRLLGHSDAIQSTLKSRNHYSTPQPQRTLLTPRPHEKEKKEKDNEKQTERKQHRRKSPTSLVKPRQRLSPLSRTPHPHVNSFFLQTPPTTTTSLTPCDPRRNRPLFKDYHFMITGYSDAESFSKRLQKVGATVWEVEQLLKQGRLTRRGPPLESRILLATGCCRTWKYLVALAEGIQLVHVDWAWQCLRQNQIVPTNDYRLCYGQVENQDIQGDPSAWSPFFTDHVFYLMPGLATMDKQIWTHILKTLGAKVLVKRPAVAVTALWLTLHDTLDTLALDKAERVHATVVQKEWLVVCLIKQKVVDLEPHYCIT